MYLHRMQITVIIIIIFFNINCNDWQYHNKYNVHYTYKYVYFNRYGCHFENNNLICLGYTWFEYFAPFFDINYCCIIISSYYDMCKIYFNEKI